MSSLAIVLIITVILIVWGLIVHVRTTAPSVTVQAKVVPPATSAPAKVVKVAVKTVPTVTAKKAPAKAKPMAKKTK